MSIIEQLLWGSGSLLACLILHVMCMAAAAGLFRRLEAQLLLIRRLRRMTLVIVLSVGAMLFAMTLQIWLWSFVYLTFSVLPDLNTSLYFSMVTYTALGYGDIVLGPGLRIFATFGAVTGLFSFGLSTAFLVAAVSRVLGEALDAQSNGENSRATGAP